MQLQRTRTMSNGYSAGYDYKLLGTDNAIVQKYRESTAYQQGFDAGAKNGNETEVLETAVMVCSC